MPLMGIPAGLGANPFSGMDLGGLGGFGKAVGGGLAGGLGGLGALLKNARFSLNFNKGGFQGSVGQNQNDALMAALFKALQAPRRVTRVGGGADDADQAFAPEGAAVAGAGDALDDRVEQGTRIPLGINLNPLGQGPGLIGMR